jgi:2-polyprenyl-3-methyl-5-hydroxy-6-metoxy-1,4-benzoquinol methylase
MMPNMNTLAKKYKKYKSVLKRFKNYIYINKSTFDSEALERRERFRDDYEILADSLATHLTFHSVVDVGCAQGFLIEPLYKKGYNVSGIEVSSDVLEYLTSCLEGKVSIGDFSAADGEYDLVACVEVAEHIAPSRSQELVDKLCSLSNSYIYFTAAPPGQGGHGHINCRPCNHWIYWFERKGYYVVQDTTELIKKDLESVNTADWLASNSILLKTNNNFYVK